MCLVAVGAALSLLSCSRSAVVREYDEIVISPSIVANAFEGSGDFAPVAGASIVGLTWQLPDGWRELPAEGLVLARLAFDTVAAGDSNETGEVTLVSLTGTGGGLELNVGRWLGQLGLAASQSNVDGVLASRQEVRSAGGLEVVVVDFRTVVALPSAQSFLAGMVPLAGRTLFFKAAASAAGLAIQREAFIAFCRSLQPARGR